MTEKQQNSHMAIFEISVSKHLLRKLFDEEITIGELLVEKLYESDSDHEGIYNEICRQLQSYHDDEGGAPEVSDFEIIPDDCRFDFTSKKGKVTLQYTVYFYFGCSDLNRDYDSHETCDFRIDTISESLTLYINEKLRRDTVEEF